MNAKLSTQKIKKLATEEKANIVGVADLTLLKGIFASPENLLNSYKYGVSIGVNLEQYGGYDNSTEDNAFAQLEKTAKRLSEYIRSKGFKSKIVPCDKRIERNGPLHWKGEISHKAIAKAAGLGWIGKSTLLVTPNFGSRICLITILTNMPLIADQPARNRCGDCKKCVESCPLNALVGAKFSDHPDKLEEAIDVLKCGSYISKTWRKGELCYSCLLACPYGKKKTV